MTKSLRNCPLSEYTQNGNYKWSPASVLIEASQHNGKFAFDRHCHGGIKAAKRFGIDDELFFISDFQSATSRKAFELLLRYAQSVFCEIRFQLIEEINRSKHYDKPLLEYLDCYGLYEFLLEHHAPLLNLLEMHHLLDLIVPFEFGNEDSYQQMLWVEQKQALQSLESSVKNGIGKDQLNQVRKNHTINFSSYRVQKWTKCDQLDEYITRLEREANKIKPAPKCSSNPLQYTERELLQIAKRYTTRFEFKKMCSGAYESSRSRGKAFHDRICGHMPANAKEKYNRNNLLAIALKFKSFGAFRRDNRVAYRKAQALDMVQQIAFAFSLRDHSASNASNHG